jgi:hypothetical protein
MYDTRIATPVKIEPDTEMNGWGEYYGLTQIIAAVVNSVAAWRENGCAGGRVRRLFSGRKDARLPAASVKL